MGGKRLPEGYVETGRWTLKQASPVDFLLAGLIGLSVPVALVVLGSLLGSSAGSDGITVGGWAFVIGIVPGTVLGVALHELVHGVSFLAFRARPRFGFKPWTRLGPVFYAAAPGSYLTKPEYAATGLAPAVLLTAALVVALNFVAASGILAWVVIWAILLNVGGSAGDMLMMWKLVPYPRTTRFEDTGEGFVAYGPVEDLTVQS
jgi:hypothetical protein